MSSRQSGRSQTYVSKVDQPRSNQTRLSKRSPLGDGANRANINLTPSHSVKSREPASPGSAVLPHHESLMNNNGPLTVRNITSSPENKRISTVTTEDQSDSKRSSQISTTSTNASNKGKKRKTHIGPWQLGSDIGKGGCGKVRLVRHSTTGQHAAAKIISKKVAEKARAESLANLVEISKRSQPGVLAAMDNVMPFGIEREVVIMKLLEHPNVVKLYDVWENRGELYLIMEYVEGGELFEYVEQHERLEEDETVWLFRQILAALLHCHRLGIHHRDLKPENILLDRHSSTVKLVDFGMAALQPRGKLLTTPCGSIHYAAPEVFEKIYDGSKVDVWSLGVILYVMLTGATPFQYDQLTMANNVVLWYNVIKSGVFHMPPELSSEARDLISKMLVPNPKHRISLEATWKHPLMSKYCEEWKETEEKMNLEDWIGAKPVIETWNIKTRSHIDREILRNLRTLWHSEKEETLIEKLLNKEPNQEKYFYYALQKHREEQLENYSGVSAAVSYSTSDYHHVKVGVHMGEIPPIPKTAYTRTKSQYSILNDEQTQSKSSVVDRSASMSSYDPYRASTHRLTSAKENYTSVVVHRGGSKNGNKNTVKGGVRPTDSRRVEALKTQQKRLSTTSSSHSFKLTAATQKCSASSRTMSRSSMASTTNTGSPQISLVVKPSDAHKRSVDFSHVRRSSTLSALPLPDSTRSQLLTPQRQNFANITSPESSPSTPTPGFQPMVRSRKENVVGSRRSGVVRSQTHSQVIDCEARKVSTELEKFCEEVFYRSSAASSNITSGGSGSVLVYDTPASSISNQISGGSHSIQRESSYLEQHTPAPTRLLAESPNETPNTFMNRELAETRKKIAARYASDERAQNPTYSEVLAHLDELINPTYAGNNGRSRSPDARRIASAPETRCSEYSSPLPVISEECKYGDTVDLPTTRVCAKQETRSTTDPFRRPSSPMKRARESDDGTGSFNQSSSPEVAPLVIRKVSSTASELSRLDDGGLRSKYHKDSSQPTTNPPQRSSNSSNPGDHPRSIPDDSSRNSSQPSHSHTLLKKKSWFWSKNKNHETSASPGEAGWRLDDLDNRKDMKIGKEGQPVEKSQMGSIEHHVRTGRTASDNTNNGPIPGKRPGFLKFLSRRASKNTSPRNIVTVEEDDSLRGDSSTAMSTSSSNRGRIVLPTQNTYSPADLGVQRNWLSRFLNIKPASRVLCFQTGRGGAREELVRLLRRWRVHGMRDIGLDRERNLIFGRLASNNILGLKEVAFVIELFVVLDKGQRAGLSMSRWTQRWGAVSSFRRIVSEVEAVLKGRGVLVVDKNKAREMEAILSGA